MFPFDDVIMGVGVGVSLWLATIVFQMIHHDSLIFLFVYYMNTTLNTDSNA